MRDKRVYVTAMIFLLAAAGLSNPGKRSINAALKKIGLFAAPPPRQDVEQRARTKHGWDRRPVNTSVMRGTITYFDLNGTEIQQVTMMLYRKYPDRVRLEIRRRGGNEVSGFDGRDAWRAGTLELRDADAREIRAWSRMWPERLFDTRSRGARYREVGRFLDERARRNAAGPPEQDEQPILADHVEMEDSIGPAAANPRNAADWRRLSYYIDTQTSLVYTARWLEPNDPRKSVDDRNTPLMDVRVDFSRWTQVDGVVWPFQITHQRGGRVDFVVQLTEVQMNQPLADTIFQRP